MKQYFYKPAIAALFACLSFFNAIAGNNSNVRTGPPPSWLEHYPAPATTHPSDRDINDGYYYALYEEQENIEEHTVYRHWITDIVNETGVRNNSQYTLEFSADFQQLAFHKVTIWRDGKELNRLDLSKIKVIEKEEDLDRNIYHGKQQALLILEDIRKGDRIEIAYSLIGENPVYAEKYDNIISFVSATLVMSETRNLIAAPNRKLQLRMHNGLAQPEVVMHDGKKIYQWTNKKITAYNNNNYTPEWFIDYPYVEISEFANWADVSSWAEKIFSHYSFTLPAGLQKRISTWQATAGNDPKLFTALATRFVQDEIRYQGIEIGVNTYKPHPPEEVYNKRYGDCKDKALLLTCILHAAGINASVALVNTDWNEHTTERLPAAGIFNHAIVKAVIDNKPVWIDPTITHQHGLITENSPGYGAGLVIAPGTKALETMPTGEGSTFITETFSIPPATDKKNVQLDVATTFRQSGADNFRQTLMSSGLQGLEHDYEQYYNGLYNGTTTNKPIQIAEDSIHDEVNVREHYDIKSFWQRDEKNRLYFAVYAKPISERLANPDKVNGAQPLSLPYPANITHKLVLKLPDAWGIADEAYELKNDCYYFSFSPHIEGKTLTLEYKLQTFRDNIPAEKLADYKKDYEKITSSLSYTFSHDFGVAADADEAGTDINWVTFFIALASIAGGIFSVRAFNRWQAPGHSYNRPGGAPDGWIAALGFVLIIKILLYLPPLVNSEYYSTEKWTLLTGRGNTLLQLWMLLQAGMHIYLTIWLGAVLYWYFHRRDILPVMFLRLGTTEVIFHGLNMMIILAARARFANYFPDALPQANFSLVHSLVLTIGWMIAIKRSDRIYRIFNQQYRRRIKQVSRLPEEPIA